MEEKRAASDFVGGVSGGVGLVFWTRLEGGGEFDFGGGERQGIFWWDNERRTLSDINPSLEGGADDTRL